MEKLDLKYKNPKEVLISIIVGFSIGLSVIIPGISGSTIAMVLKVYDKLMYSFSNVFKRFKDCILFLIPIIFGIGVGFILGFILVKALLEVFPFITICFFVGLMIGTYPILFKEIKGETTIAVPFISKAGSW
jgi:putative membrane protein